MIKEIIAVDIDDVLSPQALAVMAFSNARYGTHLTPEDFKKPGDYWGYYEQMWGVGDEEGARRFNEFKQEGLNLKQIVSEDTKQAVRRLAKKYRLEIVTSRSGEHSKETKAWLKSHIPDVFAGFHFVDLWDEPSGKATKAKICKEIGAGYLIDDNLEHCNIAAEAGVTPLLFGDFGWNAGKARHELVHPVEDWAEVLEYFDAA